MNLRTATINDLDTLLEFEQGVILTERPFDPTLKDGHINYYDLKELILSPQSTVIVAEHNDEIIASGYALIKPAKDYLKYKEYAYLGFMYVRPSYRGRGINKLILDALTGWAKSKNMTELRLQVYDENKPAVKAYEKVGFKPLLVEMRMEIK